MRGWLRRGLSHLLPPLVLAAVGCASDDLPSDAELAATLLTACDAAAIRWFDAVGIELDCDEIPFVFSDDMPWGWAMATRPGEQISVRRRAIGSAEHAEALVLHELGHWIAGWPNADQAMHPVDGAVMCWRALPADSMKILPTDIRWLCASTDCAWRQSEKVNVDANCPEQLAAPER